MRNGNLIGSGGDNTLDDADDGVDVFVVGLPVADADAHGALALECGAGEEGGAFGCTQEGSFLHFCTYIPDKL
jgi:hypothetical protein